MYKLVPERHGQVCLAGTAEMALAGGSLPIPVKSTSL